MYRLTYYNSFFIYRVTAKILDNMEQCDAPLQKPAVIAMR